MNKLLDEEIEQKVAEKHGHKWALTEFTHEAYDKSKEELSQKTKRKYQTKLFVADGFLASC